MLNKLIQEVKSSFEETQEEKVCRELKEKNIKSQENIISNIKCPICNGNSFHRGFIASTGGSASGIVNMVTTYHNGYIMECESKILVCDMCGYVIQFADFNTQSKQILDKFKI